MPFHSTPRDSNVRRLAQILAVAVENRIVSDVREAFRDAMNAGLDTTDFAKETNIYLGSRGMSVRFMDQPGNRWLITTFRGESPQDRVVVT